MTVLQPVPLPRPLPSAPVRVDRLRAAVVRRALPVLAGSAGALIATLAAERALRQVALGAVARLGGPTAMRRATGAVAGGVARTVVTEITVVERIRRRA